MSELSILSVHNKANGSLVSILDINQYLVDRECYKIKYYHDIRLDISKVIKTTYRPYYIQDTSIIRSINKIDGNLITDFASILKCYKDNKRLVVSGKIVVLDNLELTLLLKDWKESRYYIDVKLYDCLNFHKFKDIIFLMPKSNIHDFTTQYPDLKYIEFYKKVNLDMMNSVPREDNGKTLHRSKSIIRKESPFRYSSYAYTKKSDTSYYEQFGRLVFEFIILGKNIDWVDNPYDYKDGLRDYLNYYGTDRDHLIENMSRKYENTPWE